MSIVFLIALFLGIIAVEAPRLIRKKKRRELIVFAIVLALGFGLCLGQVIGLSLPNPSRIIAKILNIKY